MKEIRSLWELSPESDNRKPASVSFRRNPVPFTSARRGLLLLLLASALLWFFGLEHRSLFHPDEGRYAEIPREMVVTGDWLTPRLNGIKYFEKPPLQYWLTAGAYVLLGEHQWTSRLCTALAGFLGLLWTGFVAQALFGRGIGLLSAGVLASSVLYFIAGHFNTLDMGLTFWLNLALGAFLLAQQPHATASRVHRWALVMWAALGFAALSKGLIATVLPGLALVVYTLVEREVSWWKPLKVSTGLPLFLCITAPWFVAVSIANPEFAHFFFIHEHVERFLTTTHGRYQPWWFYIPILLLGLLPWVGLLPGAAKAAWRIPPSSYARRFNESRFLIVWVAVILVFFSASGSKLGLYILPAFPALAMLIAKRISALSWRQLGIELSPSFVIAVVLTTVALNINRFTTGSDRAALITAWSDSLVACGVALSFGMALALYLARAKKQRLLLVLGVVLMTVPAYQFVLYDAEDLAPALSGSLLAKQLAPYLQRETTVYSVSGYDQTLPFYIKRPVKLVNYLGELEFGVRQEPGLWVKDEDAFSRSWRDHDHAVALMDTSTYQRLNAKGTPMRVIARQGKQVAVVTP